MSSEQVAAYADTTGYVAARTSAIPLSATYGEGGEGELFAKLAECCAIVRPVHPAYPVITSAWEACHAAARRPATAGRSWPGSR